MTDYFCVRTEPFKDFIVDFNAPLDRQPGCKIIFHGEAIHLPWVLASVRVGWNRSLNWSSKPQSQCSGIYRSQVAYGVAGLGSHIAVLPSGECSMTPMGGPVVRDVLGALPQEWLSRVDGPLSSILPDPGRWNNGFHRGGLLQNRYYSLPRSFPLVFIIFTKVSTAPPRSTAATMLMSLALGKSMA